MMATIYRFIKNHFQNESGFTLIEMAIVTIVLGILSVSMRPFIELNVQSYLQVRRVKYAIQHTRIGMNRMIAEIRKASATDDINTFTSTEFDFDNVDDERIELTYGLFEYEDFSGLCVMFREVGWMALLTPTQPIPLIHNVSDFSFTYHDQNGNITANQNEIYSIRIFIELEYEGKKFKFMNQVTPNNFH